MKLFLSPLSASFVRSQLIAETSEMYFEISIVAEKTFETATAILEVFSHDYHLNNTILLHCCTREEKVGEGRGRFLFFNWL